MGKDFDAEEAQRAKETTAEPFAAKQAQRELDLKKAEEQKALLEKELQEKIAAIEESFSDADAVEESAKTELAAKFAPRYCRFMPKDITKELWENYREELPEESRAAVNDLLVEVDERFRTEIDNLKTFNKIKETFEGKKHFKRFFKHSVLLARK